MSETVINWFTIIYGVLAIIATIYLIKANADLKKIQTEKGLEKTKIDKIITGLIAFMAVSSIVIAYEVVVTIFKLF